MNPSSATGLCGRGTSKMQLVERSPMWTDLRSNIPQCGIKGVASWQGETVWWLNSVNDCNIWKTINRRSEKLQICARRSELRHLNRRTTTSITQSCHYSDFFHFHSSAAERKKREEIKSTREELIFPIYSFFCPFSTSPLYSFFYRSTTRRNG